MSRGEYLWNPVDYKSVGSPSLHHQECYPIPYILRQKWSKSGLKKEKAGVSRPFCFYRKC